MAPYCACPKCHWLVCFKIVKMVNFLWCDIYFHKRKNGEDQKITPFFRWGQLRLRCLGIKSGSSGVRDGTHVVSCSQTSPSSFPIASQSLVWLISHIWLFATPWTAAHQASLSFTISLSFLKLMSIKSVIPSNHLIICHPLLPLPSVFPSIRVFCSALALHITWLKYCSVSISFSNSGLISFRIDWFHLAVQGTLKNLLQPHNSKVSILQHPTFFMVQLSHPDMTTGKTIALTIQTFVSKLMSQLFNILSGFVIAVFPSSKCLFGA